MTSGPTPSYEMQPHTIIEASPILTVPSVQQGSHILVDFRHTHTRASLPPILILLSSVNTGFFHPVGRCFDFHLPPISFTFFLFLALM